MSRMVLGALVLLHWLRIAVCFVDAVLFWTISTTHLVITFRKHLNTDYMDTRNSNLLCLRLSGVIKCSAGAALRSTDPISELLDDINVVAL